MMDPPHRCEGDHLATNPARSPGRALPPGAEAAKRSTRDRILDGALDAVARHGLSKLGMADVSHSAGLSRGTVYRYFPNREDLLRQLAQREGQRFQRRLRDEVERASPEANERIRLALEHAVRLTREHPILLRLLETDPALVIESLREQLPEIRRGLDRMLRKSLESTPLVESGAVKVIDVVDWVTRLMVSAYLFPDPNPARLARSLAALHHTLTVKPELEI